MLQPRFALPFDLPPGSRVLVAGAGGGFDIVCAVPVAIALRAAGHAVHLGSYSFTDLARVPGATRPRPALYRIDGGCAAPPDGYCPEAELARWWNECLGEPSVVWCFDRQGVRPVAEAYAHLRSALDLDAVLVLDGGVDGLFRGDEWELATPSMDAVSILAAASLSDCAGVYAFTAFGTEGRAYEVRHADALERMADLTGGGALLGCAAAAPGSAAGSSFRDALDAVHFALPDVRRSIIACSIAAAMDGAFGETVVTSKTAESPVWVSPLTLLYWFFDLAAVAAAKPYRDEVLGTDRVQDVADAIQRFRDGAPRPVRRDIPI